MDILFRLTKNKHFSSEHGTHPLALHRCQEFRGTLLILNRGQDHKYINILPVICHFRLNGVALTSPETCLLIKRILKGFLRFRLIFRGLRYFTFNLLNINSSKSILTKHFNSLKVFFLIFKISWIKVWIRIHKLWIHRWRHQKILI